nr:VanW family protein [Micromonospora sp. DSM 115978]
MPLATGPQVAGPPAGGPVGEPLGPPTVPGKRRGARRMILAGGIAVAVVAAGSGTAGFAYAGEVPRGTTVLGVEIGGKSRAEAVSALHAELARRGETFGSPVQVRIGEKSGEIIPSEVGLAVDVEATVAAGVASNPSPVGRLFGSHEVDPVVTVDPVRLDERLRAIVGPDGQKMTMPAIKFTGTTPKATYPEPGIDLEAERSAQAVRDGWLGDGPVEVPLVETHPATTTEEVDQLLNELAKPAVAAPVRVTTDRGAFDVPAAAIAKSLVLTADKTGRIEPRIDEKKLRGALTEKLATVEVEAKDATLTIAGGKPKVVAGSGGQQLDTAALGKDLLTVLPKSDGREITGTLKASQPKTSTEDVAKLGVKERVSTFTTHFTGGLASPRSQNIVQAAKEVDGTLVKPGETFSLNGHTGERGYAQGYKDAPVILNGKLVPGVGGGVSQFTTTLFNATYYAGLEDVEHKPHSYYFSRYPSVIESTIFYPDLDFKFRNNTEYGVLLDTSWTGSSITVSVWSTKIWEKVSTQYGPRRNITSPKTVYLDPGPTCIPASGSQGFSQDAFRVFRKDGKEVKREKFSWTYEAEPKFICAKKP